MRTPTSSLALIALLAIACAPKVPIELENARVAYQAASLNPEVNELVPADLHKARMALDKAELAFDDRERHYRTADLAYVAGRMAQTAVAKAAISRANNDAATAGTDLTDAQDRVIRDTRADLDASKLDLAASRQSLSTETRGRIDADQRTADALATIAQVKEEERGLVISLVGRGMFQADRSVLLPDAMTRLDQVGGALMERQARSLRVEFHADPEGTHASSKALSQQRADAVKAHLVSMGYDERAIEAVGMGQERGSTAGGVAEGRSDNPRIDIVVR